jgi:hypothetical protein
MDQSMGLVTWALAFGLLFSNFVASIGTTAASPWLARLPGFDMGLLAPAAVVFGFLLGDIIERNFYTALQNSLGDCRVFIGSGVSLTLSVLTMLATFRCGARMLRVRGPARAGRSPAVRINARARFGMSLRGMKLLLFRETLASGRRGGLLVPMAFRMLLDAPLCPGDAAILPGYVGGDVMPPL